MRPAQFLQSSIAHHLLKKAALRGGFLVGKKPRDVEKI